MGHFVSLISRKQCKWVEIKVEISFYQFLWCAKIQKQLWNQCNDQLLVSQSPPPQNHLGYSCISSLCSATSRSDPLLSFPHRDPTRAKKCLGDVTAPIITCQRMQISFLLHLGTCTASFTLTNWEQRQCRCHTNSQ